MDLIWFIFVCTFYLIWLETCYLLCNTIYLLTSINHCYQKKREDYEIDSTNNEEINVSWDHFCTRKTQRESRRTTKKYVHVRPLSEVLACRLNPSLGSPQNKSGPGKSQHGWIDAVHETANIFMRDQARRANQTLVSARSMLLYIHAGRLHFELLPRSIQHGRKTLNHIVEQSHVDLSLAHVSSSTAQSVTVGSKCLGKAQS